MTTMASQITSLTVVCSIVYYGADHRKHQSSASLAFVRGIHRWPVNSPHKGPVTRKMFTFDDVIMWSMKIYVRYTLSWLNGWYPATDMISHEASSGISYMCGPLGSMYYPMRSLIGRSHEASTRQDCLMLCPHRFGRCRVVEYNHCKLC